MKKTLLTTGIILLSTFLLTLSFISCGKKQEEVKLANNQKIVEGTVIDVYNDEKEAYVTIKTSDGEFIIDCQKKSFEEPVENGDIVKIIVEDVYTQDGNTIGILFSIIEHSKSK